MSTTLHDLYIGVTRAWISTLAWTPCRTLSHVQSLPWYSGGAQEWICQASRYVNKSMASWLVHATTCAWRFCIPLPNGCRWLRTWGCHQNFEASPWGRDTRDGSPHNWSGPTVSPGNWILHFCWFSGVFHTPGCFHRSQSIPGTSQPEPPEPLLANSDKAKWSHILETFRWEISPLLSLIYHAIYIILIRPNSLIWICVDVGWC